MRLLLGNCKVLVILFHKGYYRISGSSEKDAKQDKGNGESLVWREIESIKRIYLTGD